MTFELNPEAFGKIWNGSRSWLITTTDRKINTGQDIKIKELSLQNNTTAAADTYINTGLDDQPPTKGIYPTGREIFATVTDITNQGKGLILGFQLIALKIGIKKNAEGQTIYNDGQPIPPTPQSQSNTTHTGGFRGFEWDIIE